MSWRIVATLVAFGIAGSAQAVPVVIAWQVPLAKHERYTLEVAKDSGFAQIVLTDEVKGSGYAWSTPGEGVYHWRLTRPAQNGAAKEGSTFVSGSFAAIDAGVQRDKLARLNWKPIEGADRYKLYMLGEDGRSRSLVTTSTSYAVPKDPQSLMIEVVPYSGAVRTFRDYHFNTTLTLDPGVRQVEAPKGAAASAVVPLAAQGAPAQATRTKSAQQSLPPAQAAAQSAQTAPAPQAAQVAEAAQTPASETTATAATPATSSASTDSGLRRLHMLHVYAKAAQENIHLQKLAVDWESDELAPGWGASFWTNPYSGVILSATGDYHEHKGAVTQESLFPNQKIVFAESRYFLSAALGFDVLKAFGAKHNMLAINAVSAVTQVPSLALLLEPTQLVFPVDPASKIESRQVSFVGGGLSYGYLTDFVAVVLGGNYLVDPDENTLGEGKLSLDIYPATGIVIQVAAYARGIQYDRCHEDRATCLAQGESKTSILEAGAQLGIGTIFF